MFRTAKRPLTLLGGLILCISLPINALTLEEALRLAQQNAPELEASALAQLAAREERSGAGRLPDPRLSFGLENLPVQGDQPGSLSTSDMTMQVIALSQEVPNRNRRRADSMRAAALLDLADAERSLVQLAVRSAAASGWLRLHQAERELALLEELYEHNRLLDLTVRARLAAGVGPVADRPRAALELARLDERREALTARLEQARAELRRWTGPLDGQQGTSGGWPVWEIAPKDYLSRLDTQPELAIFAPLGQERQASLALAEADRRPDWSWSLAYQRRAAGLDDMMSVQVSVGLPIFPGQRQNPRIAARQADLASLHGERESTRRRLVAELESAVADVARLESAVHRMTTTLLPLAAERSDLSLADYRAGRGSLDEVIGARQAHTELHIERIALEAELADLRTRLHLTFGEH
ncbi:TolC family protein [Pseudomonas sp.]|uniref:TolC family protein n=1 Tax=Pseudomonas sp. TaxID=306 RepID=UPI00272BAF0B|nr:TolC family protein [Pseudomonas sp.]